LHQVEKEKKTMVEGTNDFENELESVASRIAEDYKECAYSYCQKNKILCSKDFTLRLVGVRNGLILFPGCKNDQERNRLHYLIIRALGEKPINDKTVVIPELFNYLGDRAVYKEYKKTPFGVRCRLFLVIDRTHSCQAIQNYVLQLVQDTVGGFI
jgi:hypothetical protein